MNSAVDYGYLNWSTQLSTLTRSSIYYPLFYLHPYRLAVSTSFSGRLYSWSHSTWALHRAFGSQPRRWSLAYESAFNFCSSRWSPTGPTCAPRSAPRPPTAFLPITPCASNWALSPGLVFCPCGHCSCKLLLHFILHSRTSTSILICVLLLLVRTASSSTRSSCRWWCSARSTTRSRRSSPSSAKWSRARCASWRTTTLHHCSCAPVSSVKSPSLLFRSLWTLLLEHSLLSLSISVFYHLLEL